MTTLTKFPRISYSAGTPYVPADPGASYAPGYWKTVLAPTTYPVYQWVLTGGIWTFTKVGYTTEIVATMVWISPVAYRAPTPAIAAKPGVWSDLAIGWNSGADTIDWAAGDINFTFSVPVSSVGVVVGISGSSANGDYRSILHGVYASHGKLSVVESGVAVPFPTAYQAGDRIGIQRLGSVITYTLNGTIFYTSSAATTGPVFGVAALYMANDSVVDAAFGAVGGISSASLLPLTAQAFSGIYAQSINNLLPLTTSATGRPLDGARVTLELLLSAGSNRPSGYSFAALSDLTSAASGQQYIAHSAASFEPMQSMAANWSYGQSAVSMLPATGLATNGLFAPSYGASYASLSYLTNAAHGLTGEVGHVSVLMEPLRSISSDHPYGESETVMEPMTSLSGMFVSANTLEITAPAGTLYATAHDSTGENAANIIAPMATMIASMGMGVEIIAPTPTLVASATGTNWLKASLVAPLATLDATGTISSTSRADIIAPMATLIGYGGMMLSVTLTGKTTLKSNVTSGSVLRANIAPPMATLIGYGGMMLSVTLTGKTTLKSNVTSGSVLRANIAPPMATLPLFELTAENVCSAYILAPMARMSTTLQAWIIAPMATLTMIGSATVTATYEAYAINLQHSDPEAPNEVTRYTNFPFTQIVRYKNSYFGVAADGLYLLEGTTDYAVPPTVIPWAWKTATTDFKSPFQKTVVSAYFGGRLGPASTVTLTAGEGTGVAYSFTTPRGALAQNHRQVFGRGVKSRYYALGASGSGELALDDIELNIATLSRRI